jgi:hypothetical protein
MATDWIAALKEQAQLAQRFAREIPKALANPELTLDQASQIYDFLEKAILDFHRIVEDMKKDNPDDALSEAARRLEDIWASISVVVMNKLRAMQKPEPGNLGDGDKN